MYSTTVNTLIFTFMIIRLCIILLLSLLTATMAISQLLDHPTPIKDKLELATRYHFKMGMGLDIPMADIADRFGKNINFSLGFERLSKSNWFVNGDFTYRFGNTVKEDVLAGFRHSSGQFLASDGLLADVFLRERGTSVTFSIGKVIGMHPLSPQSGIKLSIGVGMMSHYIRIQDENVAIDQVMGEYAKVYDRLTRGFQLVEYVGYQYLSTDGNLNLNIGFEFNQGFTSSVRTIDFTTNLPGDTGRKDFLSGFKATWLISLYSDDKGETIYY